MNPERLLEEITRKVVLSPQVSTAFCRVDRGLFVPGYCRHKETAWIWEEPTGRCAYEDRPLTTQVRRGLPSSSSSQPSVMALMLEALDVQPGQRVLEIGTGTGYNAALLAHLVGESGQVVSVEVDAGLLEAARPRLAAAGYAQRVQLRCADGRERMSGEASESFDRLIVTAGFRSLFPAWIEQVRPGGVLVGNLRSPLFSVLLRLVKEGPEQLSGSLLTQSAWFMEIHGQSDAPALSAPDWQTLGTWPAQCCQSDPALWQSLSFAHQGFLVFLAGQVPEAQLHLRALGTPEQPDLCRVVLAGESTVLLRQDGTVEARGPLWSRIEQAYTHYQHCGSPTLGDYRIMAVPDRLIACVGERCWPIGERSTGPAA